MSSIEPYGTFPTPYGVEVPVYRPDVVDPADPDRVLFSMDATAICAGIHDKAARERFADDAKRLGGMPEIEKYGGHVLPKIQLPRPSNPAYPRLSKVPAATPVEAWITGTMDRFRWCDRAEFLLGIIGGNMEQIAGADPLTKQFYPVGVSITLTAALEHLCEAEIDCIEAAALYALTEHEEWRAAGIAWLEPFRRTWFRDWRNARPAYTFFARSLTRTFDVPEWLGRGS